MIIIAISVTTINIVNFNNAFKGAFTYYVSSSRGGRGFRQELMLFKIRWAKIPNLAYGGGIVGDRTPLPFPPNPRQKDGSYS